MDEKESTENAAAIKKDKITTELRTLKNLLAELRLKTNVITKEEFVDLIPKCIRIRDRLEDLLK